MTVVGGFLGASIASRREHNVWLRDKRLVAYTDFLVALDLYYTENTSGRWEAVVGTDHDRENFRDRAVLVDTEISRAQSAVVILGPDVMRNVTSEYHFAVEDAVGRSQAGSLEEAAEHDLRDLAKARGLVLGVMNRVLGIKP